VKVRPIGRWRVAIIPIRLRRLEGVNLLRFVSVVLFYPSGYLYNLPVRPHFCSMILWCLLLPSSFHLDRLSNRLDSSVREECEESINLEMLKALYRNQCNISEVTLMSLCTATRRRVSMTAGCRTAHLPARFSSPFCISDTILLQHCSLNGSTV